MPEIDQRGRIPPGPQRMGESFSSLAQAKLLLEGRRVAECCRRRVPCALSHCARAMLCCAARGMIPLPRGDFGERINIFLFFLQKYV